MRMLPRALVGLMLYRQFIVYRTQPKANNPTRLDKVPCDWRTGAGASAMNPANWTDYATAAQAAAVLGPNYGVGFVLTRDDPFWFLDVDNCRSAAGWSTQSTEMFTLLPGCAIEISISGDGLHGIGSGTVPPHSTAPSATLGLYTHDRFIALAGLAGSVGDVTTDCTAGLAVLVERYFPPTGVPTAPLTWTTTAREDWNGSTDDADLLRRAGRAKTGASVFGSRCTFDALWTADPAALALAFPAEDGRPYDASVADMALAQHLAYWTGHNCERMQSLMMRSALARDKWNNPKYLRETILKACSVGTTVCKDRVVATPEASDAKGAQRTEGSRVMGLDEQLKYFDGCTYIVENDAIFTPDGQLLNQSRFNAAYGGYTFVTSSTNDAMVKKAWDAFVFSQGVVFPRASVLEFDPLRAPGSIWVQDGVRVANSFVPIITPMSDADVSPFLAHLGKLFPAERDRAIIQAYMAAIVQYPGIKFQWAPLIQGAPGNGKTLLGRCLIAAIGQRYCHSPKPAELSNRFNDFLDGRIFISVEDIYHKRDSQDIIEALASMITSEYLEIEGKGTAKRTRHICCNFMINSNHVDGLQKQRWDRRYCTFFTPQQSAEDVIRDGMGGRYFPDLYKWLRQTGYAAVHGWLARYPIPDDLNPATSCHRAPNTSSTERAIEESATPAEQEIQNAITEGHLGFKGGWISSFYLDALLKATGYERVIPRRQRHRLLVAMGYDRHPGLSLGRANNPIMPDGVKPYLYIKAGHPSSELTGQTVTDAYTAAQAP